MPYRISLKTRTGEVRHLLYHGATAEACAGAMCALSCATDRKVVTRALTGRHYGVRSFTASNRHGDMVTAEWCRK